LKLHNKAAGEEIKGPQPEWHEQIGHINNTKWWLSKMVSSRKNINCKHLTIQRNEVLETGLCDLLSLVYTNQGGWNALDIH
jgi:hypothetical protein